MVGAPSYRYWGMAATDANRNEEEDPGEFDLAPDAGVADVARVQGSLGHRRVSEVVPIVRDPVPSAGMARWSLVSVLL